MSISKDPFLISRHYFQLYVELPIIEEPPVLIEEPAIVCMIHCPMHIDEVCGTDGRSYPNECALKAAETCNETTPGTVVDHAGACY